MNRGGTEGAARLIDAERRAILPTVPTYVYELRHGDSVHSTGRLTLDGELERGAVVTVAGVTARVLEVLELSDETRIVLEPDN